MRLEVEGKSPTFPLVLDQIPRIAGQLPSIPQVWLVRPGKQRNPGAPTSSDGLYSLPSPLPDQTGIYIPGQRHPGSSRPMLYYCAASPDPREPRLGTRPQRAAGRAAVPVPPARGVTRAANEDVGTLYIATAVWVRAF